MLSHRPPVSLVLLSLAISVLPVGLARVAAEAVQLPSRGAISFADLGIAEFALGPPDEMDGDPASEISRTISMHPEVVGSDSLHYVSKLDYEVDWGASPPGSLLLSTKVDGLTNTQLALDYDGVRTVFDSVGRVDGFSVGEVETRVVAASTQNYFRSASEVEGMVEFTVRAEYFDGVAPKSIRVLGSSEFSVTSIPIDPIGIEVTNVVVGDRDADGVVKVRVEYEVTRDAGRHLDELFVSMGVNQHAVNIVGETPQQFERPAEVVNGVYVVEIPAGLDIVELALAAETEYNSPARRITVDTTAKEPRRSVAGIPLWLWSLVGSLLLVVPLTRAAIRKVKGSAVRGTAAQPGDGRPQ